MPKWKVGGARDLPLGDKTKAWDADAAEKRIRKWATRSDGEVDWKRHGRAFALHDTESPENFGSYKLPFADVIGGMLTAMPKGIMAAGGVLQGARGGVDVPEAMQKMAKAMLGGYYRKMNMKSPWTLPMNAENVLSLLDSGLASFDAVTGKPARFKKEVIRAGKWVDPRDPSKWYKVDHNRLKGIEQNFRRNVKRVPVTLRHSKDPLKNVGWVEDIELTPEDRLYVYMDIPPESVAEKIRQGTIRDVSPGIDPYWIDPKTGEEVGEILDHVALTIDPHLIGMDEFTELTKVLAEHTSLAEKQMIEMERSPKMADEDKMTAVLDRADSAIARLEKAVPGDGGFADEEKRKAEMEKVSAEAKSHADAVKVEFEAKMAKERADMEAKLSEERAGADRLRADLALLLAERATRDEESLVARVETCVKDGKLAPVVKDKVVAFAKRARALEAKGLAEFEKRDATEPSLVEDLVVIFESMPKAGPFDPRGATVSNPDGKEKTYLSTDEIREFNLHKCGQKKLVEFDKANNKPFWRVGKAPEGAEADEVRRR